MSDFYLQVDVLRDQMSSALSDNEEQLAYVIASTLSVTVADELIELGSLPEHCDKELVTFNLRKLADAIQNGELT